MISNFSNPNINIGKNSFIILKKFIDSKSNNIIFFQNKINKNH